MENKDKKPLDAVKKQIFRGEVAYDINSLPNGMSIQDVSDLYTGTGVLFYDSTKGAAPYCLKSPTPKSDF